MSTKKSIASGPDYHFFHELTLDTTEPSDVFLELENAKGIIVDKEDWTEKLRARLQIPREVFDEIAIAWIKHRKLQGAVGGPVGQEWGSPDCPYD